MQYKDVWLDYGYGIEFVVENQFTAYLKSVEKILGIHEAQLLTYMNQTGIKIRLPMNFNVSTLTDGTQRFVL